MPGPCRPAERARWLRRAVTRAALGLVLAIVVAALGVVGFIATRCYASAPAIGPVTPPPAGVNGYHRSEAFTFLTLPEWFIVFSADEYAAFVASRSPAGFPFVRSARQ